MSTHVIEFLESDPLADIESNYVEISDVKINY